MKSFSFTLCVIILSSFLVFIAFIRSAVNTEQKYSVNPARNLRNISLNGKSDDLFWFVQLTDIHVSKFQDIRRAPDLIQFCKNQLTLIKPELIVVTGDLTDAKLRDARGSQQFIDEWSRYQEIVDRCREYNNGVKWLDIRGNHDSFNVPDADSNKNLFRKYSKQGERNPASYMYTHKKQFGKYGFIAMDATLDPGPKRPFNFFGFLKQRQISKLKNYSAVSQSHNMTFWFGHYPTSLIVSEDNSDIRQLMSNATVYLCGHLHTLAGLIPNMYTQHRTGMFEIELGDWKDNRIFRVLAVDHDILSFTDEQLHTDPIVLFTNPQHVQFSQGKAVKSTHIRVLVFSSSSNLDVVIYIDEVNLGAAYHVHGPLFVLPWEPENYKMGIHNVKAKVMVNGNIIKVKSQPFSLDGTIESFPLRARLVLMLNIYSVGRCVFFILLFLYVMLLSLLRKCADISTIHLSEKSGFPRFIRIYINKWIHRLWLVSKTTSLFYILVTFAVYIAVGPWFVAEVIEGHQGILFIWGLYVKDTLLPGSLTYIYGIFQLTTFNIPLLFLAGYVLNYHQSFSDVHTAAFLHRLRHLYIPLVMLILFQTYITFTEFPRAYGTKAVVLGPVRTGSIVVGVVCFILARKNSARKPAHS